MYPWKTLRNIGALLLMLPLIHLTWLVSQETLMLLNASPNTWAKDLAHYVAEDRKQHLPENALLLVGGRRASLWRNLEADLAPMPVLNRALGDATIGDIQYHYERLVGHYRPEILVLIPGNSEFHIRDSKSAGEFLHAIQDLAATDQVTRPGKRLVVFTPLKTVLYPQDDERIDNISHQLTQWAALHENITVLDANPLLVKTSGGADPRYYRPDGVNLNEHGYLRLTMLLREQLERDYPGVFGV